MTTHWVEISIASDWENWSEDYAILSESQYKRAINVMPGDILLHYIKGVHCWSGYSTVVKSAEKICNAQGKWEEAYPYKITIRPELWLNTPYELSLSIDKLKRLSHDTWHRKSYVRITNQRDVDVIVEMIKAAKGKSGEADKDFLEKWRAQRDATQSQTCKRIANYCCMICGASGRSWRELFEKNGVDTSVLSIDVFEPGWFLHAHHIQPASKGGNADLNNLLCLCPNCHQMVHKMNGKDIYALFSKLSER